MGTDNLKNTARAAGFAMAWCEDAPGASSKAPVGESTVWTAAKGAAPAVHQTGTHVPVKSPKPFYSWSLTGFTFWKTA